MPNTKYVQLSINGVNADLGDIDTQDIEISFLQNEPENWQTIQSSGTAISVPATKNNDKIFNTYHNTDILDLSPGQSFRNLMDMILSVNGTIPILRGKIQLSSATYTDKPEQYNLLLVGGNGDWIVDMQNVTLWDCLNTTTHNFTVANIEQSWQSSTHGGYDSDEFHDFVYAPVRYRQPFDGLPYGYGIDDTVNMYMLRPSISKYWLIIRAFRALGYSVNSQFLNSTFFRRQVMPWTWGDFFDVNSQLTNGISFKVSGQLPAGTPPATPPYGPIWFGAPGVAGNSAYAPGTSSGTGYIVTIAGTGTTYFRMNDTLQPNGYDNFGLYSFDDSTGTMQWVYAPPASLASFVGTNITAQFTLSLYVNVQCSSGNQCDIQLEIKINGVLFSSNSIFPGGGPIIGTTYPYAGILTTPTVFNASVSGINNGDVVTFRLKYVIPAGNAAVFSVLQSLYIDVNPNGGITSGNQWQYNPITGQWQNLNFGITDATWQAVYSTFSLSGLQIVSGSPVNFQYFDGFRNYNFLDFLGGIVDEYDLEVSTDPINMSVTIEPFLPVTVGRYDTDGGYIGDEILDGYYSTTAVNDWTAKQDLNKESTVENFSDTYRQIDFSMKQHRSDGGQNIWASRFQGIYLNNVVKPTINNTIIDNGIVAGVPGASRYMLPNRFAKGNVQQTNRFFSSCIHYNASQWINIDGAGNPPPQLIAIIPENISGSSADAISQVFSPKSAFYAGQKDPAVYGAWRWIGDPLSPYSSTTAISFPLPLMFGVSYYADGADFPILSYSDQNINGVVTPGLMRKFHMPRLATMRNGQILHTFMRMNLKDICNFGQRNCVKIGNGLFMITAINGYKPLTDESCEVVMWRFANVEQTDIDNSYPTYNEVLNYPALLAQYDIRYAQLLIFATDVPQVL